MYRIALIFGDGSTRCVLLPDDTHDDKVSGYSPKYREACKAFDDLIGDAFGPDYCRVEFALFVGPDGARINAFNRAA